MKTGRNTLSATLFAAGLLFGGAGLVPAAWAQSSGTSASSHGDAALATDPAQLINPDTAASAIEIRETPHFGSIKIRPVHQSGNDEAIVRIVLENTSALDDLHKAIRGNSELMKALAARNKSVDDVVSVTSDRNDNAIVFTRK